jgi:argininosuccinate lyase
MKQVVHDSYANSIDIAEQLVVRKGLAFRTAHRFVGSLVKIAVDKKLSELSRVSEIDIERMTAAISDDLKVKDVVKILAEMTPDKLLLLRSSTGSPNPRQQKAMIKSSRIQLQKNMKKLLERREHLKNADDNLRNVTSWYLKKMQKK